MVQGEFRFTQSDFRNIAAMLRADAGIALPEEKATLVYARLAKRVRALGLRDFGEYCAVVSGTNGADERQHMLTALTTNVTRFFREPHHFDHLRQTVLPPLLQAARRGSRVRLWSAACSTGQEPYSLAATILDMLPEAPGLDIRVLATDIDPVVLEGARDGRYETIEGTPAGLRCWFERDGDLWCVLPALRQLVTVRQLNLVGRWPMQGQFDAVMCRNVAIYFDAEVQSAVWQQFAGVVAPGGMLYIGHSERMSGPASALFESIGITAYRRRGASA